MWQIFDRERQAEVWYTIRNNKKRSIITSLGVFFGMLIFTILLGISLAFSKGMDRSFEGLSKNMVMFNTGSTTLPYQGFKGNRPIQLQYSDYEAIKARAEALDEVTIVNMKSRQRLVINGDTYTNFVTGVSENFPAQFVSKLEYGRELTKRDIETENKVCVISYRMAEEMTKRVSDAYGQTIFYNGIPFRIIGIKAKQDNITIGFNSPVIVPISYTNPKSSDGRLMLSGLIHDGYTKEEVRDEVFKYLSHRYVISPKDKEVLKMIDVESIVKLFDMILSGMSIFIWIVGMGTLLTGVISVSNILIVTVRERQREIGVRRALGAKPRDIVIQFLSEAVFLIAISGFSGLFLGLLVLIGVESVASTMTSQLSSFLIHPYPSVGLLIISVLIILFSGGLSGLLPVMRALRVKAVDAIRDE